MKKPQNIPEEAQKERNHLWKALCDCAMWSGRRGLRFPATIGMVTCRRHFGTPKFEIKSYPLSQPRQGGGGAGSLLGALLSAFAVQ
jgi:hypothetical protein